MKKTILASLLALTATTALASSVTFEAQNIDRRKGDENQTLTSITVAEKINDKLSGDVKIEGLKDNHTQVLNTRLEAGLTSNYALVNKINGFARVAVGESFIGTRQFGYYSVEPGVKVPLGIENFTSTVSWRYRSSFNDQELNSFTSRTWRAGIGYDLSKTNNVGLRYEYQSGAATQNYNALALTYTHGF